MNLAKVLEHHAALHAARTAKLRRMLDYARPGFERALQRGAERYGVPPADLLLLVCSKGRACPTNVSAIPLRDAMALLPVYRAEHIAKPMRPGVLRVFAWLKDGYSRAFFIYPDDVEPEGDCEGPGPDNLKGQNECHE